MRRRLVLFAVIVLVGYSLLLLAVYLQQDRMVFPGAGRGVRPLDVQGVATRELKGLGDHPFRIAELVPEKPAAVVVHFVGNGEDLCSAARSVVELAAYGVAVVAAEYPGYGASRGRPSVESVLRAADVAAAHAAELSRRLGVPLIVSGRSLGCFAAVHVAAQGVATKCLLCAPATSIADVASRQFWWLPVRPLLRHAFDNTAGARRVKCPVLIVHGDMDEVIPIKFGQRLREMFAGPTDMVIAFGAGHNDLSLATDGIVGSQLRAFLTAP